MAMHLLSVNAIRCLLLVAGLLGQLPATGAWSSRRGSPQLPLRHDTENGAAPFGAELQSASQTDSEPSRGIRSTQVVEHLSASDVLAGRHSARTVNQLLQLSLPGGTVANQGRMRRDVQTWHPDPAADADLERRRVRSVRERGPGTSTAELAVFALRKLVQAKIKDLIRTHMLYRIEQVILKQRPGNAQTKDQRRALTRLISMLAKILDGIVNSMFDYMATLLMEKSKLKT